MKPSLLDTDTLSFFFKGHPSVVSTLEAYSRQYGRVNLSIITYYEIPSGLKHRDANKKFEVFLDFAAQNTVLSLAKEAATIAFVIRGRYVVSLVMLWVLAFKIPFTSSYSV